jgi:hypothetical protein
MPHLRMAQHSPVGQRPPTPCYCLGLIGISSGCCVLEGLLREQRVVMMHATFDAFQLASQLLFQARFVSHRSSALELTPPFGILQNYIAPNLQATMCDG